MPTIVEVRSCRVTLVMRVMNELIIIRTQAQSNAMRISSWLWIATAEEDEAQIVHAALAASVSHDTQCDLGRFVIFLDVAGLVAT